MTRRFTALLAFSFSLTTLLASPAFAAALRVAPVTVEIARGATSTIEVENLGRRPANVQIRIFKWVQKDGSNHLLPTRDVVASPPFTKIAPGSRNVVRIVRLSRTPVGSEESYRLIIDEVPTLTRDSSLKVGIAIRYSLPVFFGAAKPAKNAINWSVTETNGQTTIKATNRGKRRVRFSSMTVADGTGRTLKVGDGLVGYVLAGSTATWTRKGTISGSSNSQRVLISAQSDNGKILSETTLQTAR